MRMEAGDRFAERCRVFDAGTGEEIRMVVSVDDQTGRVVRYADDGGYAPVVETRAVTLRFDPPLTAAEHDELFASVRVTEEERRAILDRRHRDGGRLSRLFWRIFERRRG